MTSITWSDLTGEYKASGTQQCFQSCPMCRDEKWHFYLNPTSGGYYCFKCDGKGFLGGNLVTLRHHIENLQKENVSPIWPVIDAPPTIPLLYEALEYLEKRGVSKGFAEMVGLRSSHLDRVFIPYHNEIGELIYWTARLYQDIGGEPKYKNAPGKHPLYIPLRKHSVMAPAVIVEGQFDAMAVLKAGYYAIAIGGKTLPDSLHESLRGEIQNRKRVIVCLDGDALESAIKLHGVIDRLVPVTPEIVTCSLGEDPASLTTTNLKELLHA